MRIDTDHMEIEIQAKGSKGGRNKSPSLIANIPIIDFTEDCEKCHKEHKKTERSNGCLRIIDYGIMTLN